MTTPTPVTDIHINQALENLYTFASDHYMFPDNPIAVEDIATRWALRNLTAAAFAVVGTSGPDLSTVLANLTAERTSSLRLSLRALMLYIGWSDYRIEFGTQTITPNGSMTPNYTTYDGTVTDGAGGGVSLSNSTLTDGVYGRPVDLNYLPLADGNYRLFALVDEPVLAIYSSDVFIISAGATATVTPFTVGTVGTGGVAGIGFYLDSSASPTITGSMRLQYLGVGGTWDVPTA